MKKGMSFKFKIIIIMIVISVLVTVIGIFVFSQFSGIVKQVKDATRTDLRIVAAKELLNDLTDAENSVKSFTLTRDTVYLSEYDSIVANVDSKIVLLYTGNKRTMEDSKNMDSLHSLTALKFQILNEILSLQNEFRVKEALQKVSDKIDKVAQEEQEQMDAAQVKENQRKRILSKYFKKPISTVEPEQSKVDLSSINKELKVINEEESRKEEAIVSRELELILMDKTITFEIRKILRELELGEIKKIEAKTEAAKIEVGKTNTWIVVICISIGILLIILSYNIINYVRNNNRYKKIMQKARKEAENLALAKEQFIATVSHEIRTPMNSIVGFTEQLAQGPLSEEQSKQVEIVRKASNHLLLLLNDVLDLTKLQSNKLVLQKIGFRPISVVQEVIELNKPMADLKKINLTYQVQDDVPDVLIGDPFRLRQILINLISNAIKFTLVGRVQLDVYAILKNKDQSVLRIVIKDTGIGIDESKIQRIFEEFEQAEESTAKDYGGTGLGLSITKKLVKLHHGTVDLESQPNEGTTVIVEITYQIGSEKDLAEEIFPTIEETDLSKLKILVVDDEKYNRELLVMILKKHNAILTEATNGLEALEEIEKNQYDLILMDVRMPKMTGVEATRKIRAMKNAQKKDTPVIILTAAVTEEEKQKYFDEGINRILPKPFKEQELLQAIISILHINGGNVKLKDSETENLESNNDSVVVDFSDLKKLSETDPDFYMDMLLTLQVGIMTGMDNLNKAFVEKDWKNMAEYAHKMSSPSKHVRANTFYKSLKEIEKRCRNTKELETILVVVKEAQKESKLVIEKIQKEIVSTGDFY